VTPLLALHGFTGSPDSWGFLSEGAIAFHAPALVGHARTNDAAQVTSFEDEVDRLARFIPAQESAHVVGYSLGARLALGMALRHPERVLRLTLISGHPGLTNEDERRARRAADGAWIELLLGRGVLAFVDAWEAQPLWTTQAELPEAQRRRHRALRLSHEAAGLARSLRLTGLAEMPDYSGRLAELGMPVSVLAGALDGKFSALARSMAERLRRPTLEIVAGAGHDLLQERPEFVTEVIRRGIQT
jgi:2-succinyl-6-hydroxy-2,4-cyclohexadiene-1-carboxylate synthase